MAPLKTAHDLLMADHALLRKRIAELEEALEKSPARVASLYDQFKEDTRQHLQREDTIYFPFIDSRKQISDRELMHTLRNDHAASVFALESLSIKLRKNMPLEEWRKKLVMLTSVLLPHFDQEERDLFPKTQKLLRAPELAKLTDALLKTY